MKDDNKAFTISYSGADNDELKMLKAKYTQSQKNEKINEVRRLDRRVEFISTMISIGTGMIGSFLLVHGIVFLVQNPEKLIWGSISTLLGLFIVSFVPMLHFKILKLIKKSIGPKILALIKEIEENKF